MPSDRDIELAHPEAFDFVFGNLSKALRVEFDGHLAGCRYCQSVVGEYAEVGRILKNLPPHVEPSADLEDRTVAAMAAVLAEQRTRPDRRPDTEDQAATRLYPVPQPQSPAEDETRLQPRPQLGPLAQPQARPMVTRPPVWRRYRARLATAVAIAAAIVAAAIVVPLSLGGGGASPAQATVVITLHATAAAKVIGAGAASGRATARQDASGSWDITLSVHGLKNFGDSRWYECWYVSPQRQVASAGTFLVPDSGSGTFSMTSAVDPREFRTMEVTIGPPSRNGALPSMVVLSGQEL